MMKPIKIYLSHPIRGPKGDKATAADMLKNNEKAIEIGIQLRSYFFDWQSFSGLPEIQLYIPAEHEDVISYLLYHKYITVDQLLEADCNVVGQSDILLMYGRPSSGMKKEFEYADENDIAIVSFNNLNQGSLFVIRHTIEMIIKGRK